jgi:perosamine synthetase
MFKVIIDQIREIYKTDQFIPLHAPVFPGNEKKYLMDCIDTTFVSSVGKYVEDFEKRICEFTGLPYSVATTNGTSALHLSLILAGVDQNSAVITQSLTFVATANSIAYCGALPLFVDSAKDNLGMDPNSLRDFLSKHCERKANGEVIHRESNKVVKACVPMHVFGHPCDTVSISKICQEFGLFLIEDCAESLGSLEAGKHTGGVGSMATLSFNGNKIMTTGGGGMILFRDKKLAEKARHLSTTAKLPHAWEFIHDQIGYNYRLPNINAALGCAQLESLPKFLENKRLLSQKYSEFFQGLGVHFIQEPKGSRSNYWLNAILLKDKKHRDECLQALNEAQVMARPLWNLMHVLPAFKACPRTAMPNAEMFSDRLVNIPSGVIL